MEVKKAPASVPHSCQGRPRVLAGAKPVWEAIAAKVDADNGKSLKAQSLQTDRRRSLLAYIGPNGAGHYVKMVHNGIEYGDMQMICEAYDLMQSFSVHPTRDW